MVEAVAAELSGVRCADSVSAIRSAEMAEHTAVRIVQNGYKG